MCICVSVYIRVNCKTWSIYLRIVYYLKYVFVKRILYVIFREIYFFKIDTIKLYNNNINVNVNMILERFTNRLFKIPY